MRNGCPVDPELSEFVAGELPPDESTVVSEHVRACPRCAARVAELRCAPPTDALLADLRRVAVPEPPSDPEFQAAVRDLLAAPKGRAVQPGDVLAGYRLVEVLGEGGMGVVYRAVHTHLESEFALKVIRRARRVHPQAVDRFRREMRAAGKLRHDNLVKATDAGVADGVDYLVMEFVPGTNLARLVRDDGPLPPARACELVRQAACGLDHAHQHGLVHRDVKPSNLLLGADGVVRVLDLGLALLPGELPESLAAADAPTAGAPDDTLTSPGQQLGTRDYAAPEQLADSHRVDHRADVYGLGCTLVYLLTGKPLAGGPRPAALPRELWEKFLAAQPAARFASMRDAAEALAPYCAAPPERKRRGWIAAAALAALGASAVAAVVVLNPPPTRTPDPDPAPTNPPPLAEAPPPRAVPARGALPMTPDEARACQTRWADHLRQPVAVTNTLGMSLVLVPPGEFALSPVYRVTITKPYRVATTETTFAQYDRFVRATGYQTAAERRKVGARFQTWRKLSEFPFPQDPVHRLSPGWGKYDPDQPIGYVTWADVDAFCTWLSAAEGRTYRLPTHAEWAWACRAGAAGACYWDRNDGRVAADAGRFAWTRNAGADRPQPVGALLPNAWGLHDMIGNVEELVRDHLVVNYTPSGHATDPAGPPPTPNRVTCGGSYAASLALEPDRQTGAALRTVVYSNQGFRVVLDP